MVKQSPNLRLVGKDGSGPVRPLDIADGLGFTAVEDLGPVEAKRVERALAHVCPRGGLLAVARTVSSWDIRPVLALADEQDPSLVRFAGPDLPLSHPASGRLRELYERASRFKHRSAALLDWGIFEDQLWYRRRLLPATLGHQLSGDFSFRPAETIEMIRALVEEVHDWHSFGLIHGHISSANVAFAPEGEPLLLDPGIAAALVQAAKDDSSRYGQSLAPELCTAQEPDYAADVFGSGQVIRRLLLAVRKQTQFSEEKAEIDALLEPYLRIANSMVERRPERRPKLAEVRAHLRELKNGARRKTAEQEAPLENRSPSAAEKKTKRVRGSDDVHLRADSGDVSESLHHVVWSRDEEEDFSRTHEPRTRLRQPEPPFESRQPKKTRDHREHNPIDHAPFEASAPDQVQAQDEQDEVDFFGFEPAQSAQPAVRKGPGSALGPGRNRPDAPAGGFGLFLLVLGAVLAGIWVYFRGVQQAPEYFDPGTLRTKWESRIRSRMAHVAQAALQHGDERETAEEIIVRSAMHGDVLDEGVDVGLLRVAFNGRWEKELTLEDRRMALALGLAGLLDGSLPADLGALDEKHPGIILAVTGSAGRNAQRFLRTIPAGVLTKLPPPYGAAFAKLLEGRDSLTCADEPVQQFARLTTRGAERAEELAGFLREDTARRLFALALMFSSDNQLSKDVLAVLVDHPNINIDHPQLRWAREWGLTKWSDTESGDQLFILAGAPPAERVSAENLGKMFMHPAPELRVYAVREALDRIKFGHPGSWEVMQRIIKQPDLLTPDQLFKLAEILEKPERVNDERVKGWLATQPPVPVDIAAALLLATAEQAAATRVDAWLAVYLKTKGWEPDVLALKRLSGHPDDYTRLFAYSSIFKMKDQDTARIFLKTALAKEKNADYQQQLELMISQLK